MRLINFIALSSLTLLVSCSGGGGGGGGSACLGSADPACTDTQYCQISSAGCGLTGTSGNCREMPADCASQGVSTVCTCDGLTFDNECWAAQAAQSVATNGECA